jgi:hypothetical protein
VTISPDGAVLLVDLSNLCRDERVLGENVCADLSLFEELRSAVDRSDAVNVSEIRAVADRSLLEILGPDHRRQLRELERSGTVEFSTLADERLLSLAFEEGSTPAPLVASMDAFDDFRRAFPAIQGSTDRFVGWERTSVGAMVVFLRDMGVHTHRRMSRKEESAELKARRLRRDSIIRQAVANYYRCSNPECFVGQFWPERMTQLPMYDDASDRFVCPNCQRELTIVGARPAAVQLIVFLHGEERLRLLVSDGERIQFGRRHTEQCFGLEAELGHDNVAAVSRRHVAVRLDGGTLLVEDLGSRNGTILRSGRSANELKSGISLRFGPKDVVALPSGITIERSGRSFPMEHPEMGDAPATKDVSDAPRSVTRLLGRRTSRK